MEGCELETLQSQAEMLLSDNAGRDFYPLPSDAQHANSQMVMCIALKILRLDLQNLLSAESVC